MSELLKVARRNLRQYLFKASFSSAVDKQAAIACLDVIEKELDALAQPAEAVEDVPNRFIADGLNTVADVYRKGDAAQGDGND